MKVKAINIDGARNITLNKIYAVVEEKETAYVIKNDRNENGTFKKNRFTVVNEADLVIKVGNVYENEGEHFMIVAHDILGVNFVALVSVKTGFAFTHLVHVADTNNITAVEFDEMTAEEAEDFIKVVA
jgi:hypothetical protein